MDKRTIVYRHNRTNHNNRIIELQKPKDAIYLDYSHAFASFTVEKQLGTELINNSNTTLLFKMTVKKVSCRRACSIKEKFLNNETFSNYYNFLRQYMQMKLIVQ